MWVKLLLRLEFVCLFFENQILDQAHWKINWKVTRLPRSWFYEKNAWIFVLSPPVKQKVSTKFTNQNKPRKKLLKVEIRNSLTFSTWVKLFFSTSHYPVLGIFFQNCNLVHSKCRAKYVQKIWLLEGKIKRYLWNLQNMLKHVL